MTEAPTNDSIKILDEMYANEDPAAIEKIMDPTIVWHEPEGFLIGGTYQGPDAVREALDTLLSAFVEASFEPEHYVQDGETVIVFGTFTGTHGETAKSVVIPLVHVWEFTNEKAVKFTRYTDTARLNWAFEE